MTDDSKKRQAYLSLWTEFVMAETGDAATLDDFAPLRGAEVVKYIISPAGIGGVILSTEAATAYQTLAKGMPEELALASLAEHLWEDGEMIDTPDDRTRRRYFQIGDNAQFWAEFARQNDGKWSVARKSPLEKKTVWHRYPNGKINLPLE
ncbi:hypothetical protein AGMMS49959_05060 [Planctomycetales bacterium]|nr:hypothetical protein AGMMS49959_05060 [Planctomycetales bacterium]